MLLRAYDRLPPIWSVAALFLGLTLPQALLGLPVAAAAIGALPSLAILAAIGALMTVAAAAEAEALARDGEVRREGTFFGRVVQRYLGAAATVAPNLLAALRTGLSLLGAYIGFCVTLAALTGLPRVAWGLFALLSLAALLLRGGLRIPSAIGATLGLLALPPLAAIAVIAALHGGGGVAAARHVDATAIGGVVGVVLMLYISNVYVVAIARETLPRDPGGRALVRGSALGAAALTLIAAAWLLATSAALRPEDLTGEVGTVLGPLSSEVGASVAVLGSVLIVLLLGLGLERTGVAVMRLASERLSGRARPLGPLAPLAVCGLGEALLSAGAVSFTDVFAVAGMATNALLALAVPMLLLLAARARGDVELEPGAAVPVFGRPAVAWALVGAAALLLVLFATVLTDVPLLHAGATISLLALVATVWAARRDGAFG